MEFDQDINAYCQDNGVNESGLEKYCKEILAMASRTNSAYSANIALQIILGIMKPTPTLNPTPTRSADKDTQSQSQSQSAPVPVPPLTRNPFSFNSLFTLPTNTNSNTNMQGDSDEVGGNNHNHNHSEDPGSGYAYGYGSDPDGDQGQLIISADSSLARPIYIDFKWKQVHASVLEGCVPVHVAVDSDGGDTSDGGPTPTHSASPSPGLSSSTTVSPAPTLTSVTNTNSSNNNSNNNHSNGLVWCLVSDIKCATVYKVLHSDDIEDTLLRLKVTYYKQYIYNESQTYSRTDINKNAQLFLDQDIKLSSVHDAKTWVSEI